MKTSVNFFKLYFAVSGFFDINLWDFVLNISFQNYSKYSDNSKY